MIELNGHVIAMAVSDDENELFVNVRSWPENAVPTMDDPPPIASQIETIVIDLNTLERTPKVKGRKSLFNRLLAVYYPFRK